MSKILLTGATGAIGKDLTEYLFQKNENIIAQGSSEDSINRLKDNLSQKGVDVNKIEFWQQNFLENDWITPDLKDVHILINCAAMTKVREGTFENYDKYLDVNVNATKRLANLALKNSVSHFIHFSTGQVFGHPTSFPITEKTPKNPINLYGFTKLMAEYVVSSFGLFGLNYSIVRPFSVYGIGHHNIISIIRNKIKNNELLTIYGDGEQKRSFTHVNDICRAVYLIINNPRCYNQDFNLSGPKEYSVNDLIQLFQEKYNIKAKISYKKAEVNELLRNFADLSKIKELGFEFRKSLEDFIRNELE